MKTQADIFLCTECRDKFTVRTGTVMERRMFPAQVAARYAPHSRFREA